MAGETFKDLIPADAYLLTPVHIKAEGQKHVLLLLHGFSSSPAVYRELLPLLPPTMPLFAQCYLGMVKALPLLEERKLKIGS